MSEYNFYIWNKRNRVKYPRTFDLPNVEAARSVALKIARIFVEVVPYWGDLSSKRRNDFVVEIRDQDGQTVLSVPFRKAEEPKS